MLIKRNRPNMLTIERIKIFPGVNSFDKKEEIETLEKHPLFVELMENGVHTKIEKPAEKDPKKPEAKTEIVSSIELMNMNDALKVVKDTLNPKTLEQMIEAEEEKAGRKKVLRALEKQLESLKVPEDERESAGSDAELMS